MNEETNRSGLPFLVTPLEDGRVLVSIRMGPGHWTETLTADQAKELWDELGRAIMLYWGNV